MQPTLRSGVTRRSSSRVVTFSALDVEAASRWPATPGPEACPGCDTVAVNAQGVVDCPDCGWFDRS